MASRATAVPLSPFQRLRDLLGDTPPGAEPIDLSIGAPRHPFPPRVVEVLVREAASFGAYPSARGTPAFRQAVAGWLTRRFGLNGAVDPDRHVLPLAGSREGLFSAAFLAVDRARARGLERPYVLLPNPHYPVYPLAALAAGAVPYPLAATAATGDLPDLAAIPADVLARTAAFYHCSPANPQGTVADLDYLGRLAGLARDHDFLVFSDECYSELYRDVPPASVLATGGDFDRLMALNSLSKRSSLPGLRVGFVAGDARLIDSFFAFRNVVAPTVPTPVQIAAAELYGDEDHVAANRRLYNEKFAIAADILAGRFGAVTPPAGFFLWLDMRAAGGGEAAAARLWAEAGVKVVPGAYLAIEGSDGANPGADFVRVALVSAAAEVGEAMSRMVEKLG
jgi:aspartate/methionine/tyrosine aminotransferase